MLTATRMKMSGTDLTPSAQFKMMYISDVMNTTATFDASPIPKYRITSGIKLIAGMGRMKDTMGVSAAETAQLYPITRPNGTPTMTAAANPVKVLSRLATKCTQSGVRV